MNDRSVSASSITASSRLVSLIAAFDHLLARFPSSITQLVMRVALAVPFWRSGLTKWDGFLQLSDTAVYLFTEEFRLHLPGGTYAYPAPAFMAFISSAAEIVLPILLVIGLGTRFAAFGLLLMTIVIQLTIPDGWANFHLPWAAMALGVMTFGGGRLSLDHFIARGPGR